jgi:protease I
MTPARAASCSALAAEPRPPGKTVEVTVTEDGFAPDRMRRYPEMLALVRAVFEKGGVEAFICHAAWVPISAGILKGRRATCVRAIRDDVVNAGAHYVDEPVVVDGNLISSRTPADLPQFCLALIAALAGESPA